MKKLRTFLTAIFLWLSPLAAALAQQSSPNWSYGYTPTPAEWNHWFAIKSDWPGSASCLLSGCTMTGPFVTVAPATTGAGINLPHGSAPTTPNNGDIWTTATGFYARINGVTQGPFTATGSSVPTVAQGDILFGSAANVISTLSKSTAVTRYLSNTGTTNNPAWAQVALSTGVTGTITPQGRLTLALNTPVMTTSTTLAGTLRYDCYNGNLVPYFDGTADQLDTIAACEVADTMVSAASAGQVVSGQVYDVWWTHGGAFHICLAMSAAVGGGGGWASDAGGTATSRGTGYTQLDRVTRPYTTNKNSITNCFNGAVNYGPVTANQGTYLGTVLASGNGQISHTYGTFVATWGPATFGVWNMYNRRLISTQLGDTTSTWTYAVANVWRAPNGNTNNARVTYVAGLSEDDVTVINSGSCAAGASTNCAIGVGLDSTTAFTGTTAITGNAASSTQIAGYYSGASGAGLHFVSAIELQNTTTASTWAGTAGTTYIQTGLTVKLSY